VPEILTIEDLAALLKMDRKAIYGMTRRRHKRRYGELALPVLRINGHIRFRRQDVMAWLERLAKENPI